MLASSILYPFNLIRSRQQQLSNNFFDKILNEEKMNSSNSKDLKMKSLAYYYRYNTIYTNLNYGNFRNSAKIIFNSSGFSGFYKGMTPLLIRQIPSSSAFFYTYEFSLKYLNESFN